MPAASTMPAPTLSLIVIYAVDINASRRFYEQTAGLRFTKEQHGAGPVHYAAELPGGAVFEVYPAGPRTPPTRTRLGFTVPGADEGAHQDPDGNTVVIDGG